MSEDDTACHTFKYIRCGGDADVECPPLRRVVACPPDVSHVAGERETRRVGHADMVKTNGKDGTLSERAICGQNERKEWDLALRSGDQQERAERKEPRSETR